MARSYIQADLIRARRLPGGLVAVRVALVLVLAFEVLAAHAVQELRGRAVRVTDGDTIVVEDGDRHRHKVRIVSVDAPEKGRRGRAGQPYAELSRRHLALLVEGKPVRLVTHGRDDYGRVLARVRVSGAAAQGELDVGLEQVCAGYAWLYEAFARMLSPAEQHAYQACQATARTERRGLWQATNPTPPWVWRHAPDSAPAR